MNYAFIVAAYPIVAFVTPYVTQLIKMLITPAFIGKNVDYRMIMRLITGVIAAITGLLFLVFTHTLPTNLYDTAIFVIVIFSYGLGGGTMASGIYSFINGYLSQSPGPLPPQPIVPKEHMLTTVSAPEGQGQREPY